MNPKFVYNAGRKIYAGTLNNMAEKAANEGYEFFLFNDRVYHIDENKRHISKTNLTKNDIL